MKHRTSTDICVDILYYCNGERLNTLGLMQKARLNHGQVKNFTAFLVNRGYLTYEGNEYKTTESGIRYLEIVKPVAFTARANTVVA